MEIDAPRTEELKKQILLVEDEGLIAADIQGRLERLGYAVPAVVDSGEEALRCARATPFDLVLMDIRLNGEMDGIDAAQALKTDCQTPVVYITAHADPKTIQRAKLTGPFGYVLKPIVDGDLLSAVEIATYKHGMERKEVGARAAHSERTETVANLAAGLARDFNEQLSIILGNAEELCERLSDADRQKALEIRRSASMASSITRQLLTLSRSDAAELQLLNVDHEIGEMEPSIRKILGKKWTLATDLGSPPAFVCYDRDQFRRVVLDLAFNARNEMPGGGTLRIDTRIVELGAASRVARQCRPGRYVRLRVTDSRQDLGEEISSDLFEPFAATKKLGFGTGLSLSIVHSIVTGSGGYLAAVGEEGRGVSFEILSPCVSIVQTPPDVSGIYELMRTLEAEHKMTQQAIHNLLYQTTGEEPSPTVLLIDQEDAARRLMHNYLEGEGYKVLEARNAKDAQRIAEEAPIQILITNVILPDLTGPQLAEQLHGLRPDIKVLFVSGSEPGALESERMPSGNTMVLQKPFRVSELLQCLERLLNPKKLAAN